MLEVTVSPSNPVFMLVMKRVGLALRSFVLDRRIAENTKDTGKHPPLPTPALDELDAIAAMCTVHLYHPIQCNAGGLDAVMGRVRQLAVNVASLADHNHKVHAQRYTQLVRHVVRHRLSQS